MLPAARRQIEPRLKAGRAERPRERRHQHYVVPHPSGTTCGTTGVWGRGVNVVAQTSTCRTVTRPHDRTTALRRARSYNASLRAPWRNVAVDIGELRRQRIKCAESNPRQEGRTSASAKTKRGRSARRPGSQRRAEGSTSPAFCGAELYVKSSGGFGPWPLSKADEIRSSCTTVTAAQEYFNCPGVAGTAQDPFILEIMLPRVAEQRLSKPLQAEKKAAYEEAVFMRQANTTKKHSLSPQDSMDGTGSSRKKAKLSQQHVFGGNMIAFRNMLKSGMPRALEGDTKGEIMVHSKCEGQKDDVALAAYDKMFGQGLLLSQPGVPLNDVVQLIKHTTGNYKHFNLAPRCWEATLGYLRLCRRLRRGSSSVCAPVSVL